MKREKLYQLASQIYRDDLTDLGQKPIENWAMASRSIRLAKAFIEQFDKEYPLASIEGEV